MLRILIFTAVFVTITWHFSDAQTAALYNYGQKWLEYCFLRKKCFRAIKNWFRLKRDYVCSLPPRALSELCERVFSNAEKLGMVLPLKARLDEHSCETKTIDGFWNKWYSVRASVYNCGREGQKSFLRENYTEYYVSTDNTPDGLFLLRLSAAGENLRPIKRIKRIIKT